MLQLWRLLDCAHRLIMQAFAALRILSEQMFMQQCSSHTITQGISVDVTSAFSEVSLCCLHWMS